MTALTALCWALPAVGLAFGLLAVHASRSGARRLPRGWVAFAATAAALWLAASRLAGGSGVAGLDEALAGAFTLLVLAHAAVQLVALRPLLGTRLARRPPVAFLVLPLIVYGALLPWTANVRPPDGDEPYYLLLTHSLVQDGDTDLADDYAAGEGRRFLDRPLEPQPGDPTGPAGEIYSRHNLLLPSLLALPYAVAGKAGALAAMALFGALLAWRTLGLAARVHPQQPGGALLAFGTLSLASPLVLYSGQVWVEVPAALALVVALERLLDWTGRHEEGGHGGPPLRWFLAPPLPGGGSRAVGRGGRGVRTPGGEGLAFALAVAALPLLKVRFALVAIPLVAVAAWRLRHVFGRRALLATLGLGVLAGVGVLAYNQMAYGNALKIHSWQELDLARFGPGRYLQGFVGLFFDSGFGLFGATPLWLLTLPALVLGVLRRDRFLALAALLAAPYLLFAAPREEWYGGWSPPFRYGMVFLPLLALVLVPLFAERRRSAPARVLTAFFAGVTLVLLALFVTVPGWAYNVAHGRTHLTDRLSMATGLDVARFLPSYVRPRTASWVWPPLALAVTGAAFLAFRRPSRRFGPGSAAVAGTAVLLLAAGALPLLAARLPTRTVELEDPWIDHRGGHLYPEMWTVSRVGYRGGWVLRPSESLAVPVVAGGPRLALELQLRFVRNNPDPLTLEVLAGDEVFFRWTAAANGEWRRLVVPARTWKPGTSLGLRTSGPSRGGLQNGILLDRLEISWP